jgi:AcrR family transcriptional regulator
MARYQVGIQTETRIVDAARELLAERGLEGTTLKAICDLADVRSGSFYNLFDSKEEVVLRVVAEAIAAVDPHPGGPAAETVADLVEAYVSFVSQQPELARIYIQVSLTGGMNHSGASARFLRHHERRVERFAAAISRAEPSMDTKEATMRAEVLLGALDGLAFRWILDLGFDFAGHARRAAERFGF